MPKRTNEKKVLVEVPEYLAEIVKRMVAVDELGTRQADGTEPLEWSKFSEAAEAAARDSELVLKRRALQQLDERAKVISIEGKKYRRVGRYEGTYYTKAGPVTLMRTLYRDASVRNDRTVDAIRLKLGCVEDGWLPEAADAIGFMLQAMPAAEAEKLAKKLGRVPYSKSSFKRVGLAVGALYEAQREDIDDALIAEAVIPDKVRSLTILLDRVSLPMEEPRKRQRGRPKKGEAKRPITRAFRMAWVGSITLNDADGTTMSAIRYGQMPTKNPSQLLKSMKGDVVALLGKRPTLKVAVLCDGGAEVVEFLDEHFTEETLKVPVTRLNDFWHVIEKLGKAAKVIFGSDAPLRVDQWKMRLLNSSHARGQILEELRQSGHEWTAVSDADQAHPVHEAMTYLTNQADRMRYAEARAAGLPIGSGNVEATCKSLVALRMKRPGSRWKTDSGQAVLSLRALALSDRWDRAMHFTLTPLHHEIRAAA
jgi:hypothetical protein